MKRPEVPPYGGTIEMVGYISELAKWADEAEAEIASIGSTMEQAIDEAATLRERIAELKAENTTLHSRIWAMMSPEERDVFMDVVLKEDT
jgi:peptidoglycan hydrolase CwlO-like protein